MIAGISYGTLLAVADAAAMLYYLWYLIADLRFYAQRQWDFSIKNPDARHFVYGGRNPSSQVEMSAKARIFLGYPLTFAGLSYFMYQFFHGWLPTF